MGRGSSALKEGFPVEPRNFSSDTITNTHFCGLKGVSKLILVSDLNADDAMTKRFYDGQRMRGQTLKQK